MATTPFQDAQVYTVQTTLTSSAILNSAATNLFQSIGDGVVIEDIICETDATGLAAGTLFQLKRTDSYGANIILSHAVASLGANVTIDMSTATTKNRSVVGSGKYITSFATGADCTGAGTVRVTIKYRRVNSNSLLQAV